MNEQTIATFITSNTRLQLLKITKAVEYAADKYTNVGTNVKYQVRINRKVIETSISEYQMRKLFATYAQNIILQLTIY